MLTMAVASLRARKGAALGGLVALFFAAALVSACGELLETGLSGTVPPGRFAAAPVVVTGDQQVHWIRTEQKHGTTKRKVKSKDLPERVWVPASIGRRLSTVPGATVTSDRTFAAALFRSDHRYIPGVGGKPTYGHDWSAARLTPYKLLTGHAPTSSSEIVLDHGLAREAGLGIGDRIHVQSTRAPATFTVSGIARAQSPVTQESAVFFSEPEAAALAMHHGSVAAYGVFGASAAAVRAALGDAHVTVVTGDARGAAALPRAGSDRTRLTSMSAAIGGTALVVAMLVVVGTFTLSIQQRHRELALLRAMGATPRQVRRLVNREAVLLGLLAGPSGAVAGLPLASAIHHELVSSGTVPDAIRLSRHAVPVVLSVLVTLLTAVTASRISARRVSRIRPVEALSEGSVEPTSVTPVRTLAGILAAAGGLGLSLLLTVLHTEPAAVPVSYLCVLLWMIGVALNGPFLARVGVDLLGVGWRTSRVGGFLAGTNSRTYRRRTGSVLAPLTLLIAMSATILFVPTTIDAAVRSQTQDGLRAGWVLSTDGPGIPAAAVSRLRSTRGVTAAVGTLSSTLWIGRHKQSVEGLSGGELTTVVDPDVSSGSVAHLGVDDVALSSVAAHGRRVGDKVPATFGDGARATLRIVAVYRRGLGFGDSLVSFDRLAKHVDTPLAEQVLISGSARPPAVRGALAPYAGLHLMDRSDYRQVLSARQSANDAAGLAFLVLVVAFCAIAVVNTVAMATGARSRELSLLRLAGATPRQVRAVLAWELALAVVLAIALAALTSWAALTGFSIGVTGRATPTVRPSAILGIVLCATVLGALALFIPVQGMLRRNPAEAMTIGQ